MLNDLGEIGTWIDQSLTRGAVDARHAFHWPTLGTIAADGTPSLRTVVLRKFDPSEHRLLIYTDRRSEKAVEISGDQRVSIHLYDPRTKVQLRLHGLAALHTEGPVWADAWSRAEQGPLFDYSQSPPPGTVIDGPDACAAEGADPGETFAVIAVDRKSTEYLRLSRQGHRRALFTHGDDGKSVWLAP